LVVLVQPSAYFTCLYPNHWIVACGIPNRALKQINSYCAFLKSIMVPIQAVADHIRQKLLAAFARLKYRAVQDSGQLAKDRLLLDPIENVAFAINLSGPDLTSGQTHGIHSLPFLSTAIAQDKDQDHYTLQVNCSYGVVTPVPASREPNSRDFLQRPSLGSILHNQSRLITVPMNFRLPIAL
jgi:hypothetical protein